MLIMQVNHTGLDCLLAKSRINHLPPPPPLVLKLDPKTLFSNLPQACLIPFQYLVNPR